MVLQERDIAGHHPARRRQIDRLECRRGGRIGVLEWVLGRLGDQVRHGSDRCRSDVSQLLRRNNTRRRIILVQEFDERRNRPFAGRGPVPEDQQADEQGEPEEMRANFSGVEEARVSCH